MFPLIRITFVGLSNAFEVMVTDLLIGPNRLESYLTFITAALPGAIGSRGQEGTVQPQLPLAFEMIRGSLPVLVNLNCQLSIAN